MIGRFLKTFVPRSLFGRATLIVLVPVVTILLVVSVVFIQRLYENVTRQMTQAVASEIALILDRIERAPVREKAEIEGNDIAVALGLAVAWKTDDLDTTIGLFDVSGRTVVSTLRTDVETFVAADLSSIDGVVLVQSETKFGPITIEVPRLRVSARNPHQFLVLIGTTAVLMSIIALLYLRGQVRPIRRLAAAATAFGKGRKVPYRPSGASEVREAGQAFLEMRDRIDRHLEQRTLMLSGVSHDLRTPLTRMKLTLSLMEDSETSELLSRDIAEMQKMLDAFLDFAKIEAMGEPKIGDIHKLLSECISDFKRSGSNVQLHESVDAGEVQFRPMALKRAVSNLIGNAVRYGAVAHVSVQTTPDGLVIVVEDDGPGIPPDLRDEAVKPFTRLDKSRNQDDGSGTGLGLAIARDIARQHGGTIELSGSENYGGLKVSLRIPR